DDLTLTGDVAGPCTATVTPYLLRRRARSKVVPCFHWGSWMDAGTAAGVLARFASDPDGAHYVIGAWSHGGELDTGVFRGDAAPIPANVRGQNAQMFDFLAPLLQGDSSARPRAGLSYFTMGENAWKHTSSWPIAGCTNRRWFLAPDGTLQTDAPAVGGGSDR